MGTERRHYDDGYARTFTGRIVKVGEWQGQPALELAETWFYAEMGGQLGDRGRIGSANVTDVQVDESGHVWHVVDAVPAEREALACEIDWARRFDHMQQHTGQHVLSAALEREFDVPTLSSSLRAERNVIEIGMANIDWRVLESLVRIANQVLWDDRELRLHWTDDAGIGAFPLRKPPKVEGRIRVVEIPDWDFSACGGTHVRRTGEVGAIQVIGWDKVRGNVRLLFHCGGRALADHAWRTEALIEAAKRRTVKDADVLAHLERLAEERDAFGKQLRDIRNSLLATEVKAKVGDPPRGFAELSATRTGEEARAVALHALSAGAPWVVSAASGAEPVVVLARAKALGGDLRSLLPELLAVARGKGGGSPEMLQVSAADGAAAQAAFALARERLATWIGG